MVSFIVLLLIIFATFYISLIYINEALMLLAFMEATFFVVSLFYLLFRRFTIKARLHIPIKTSETGKDNLVKIIISNSLPFSQLRISGYIIVKENITGKTKGFMKNIGAAHDDETEFKDNIVFGQAGSYDITLKKIRIYDITGLMHMNISINDTEQIHIMPKIYDVPVKLTMAVKNFYGESDVYDENNPGHDNSELFQIREYQKGDRLQSVHWKMTAKQDEIMVKEHSIPKSCPVILFLDFNMKRYSRKSNRVRKYLEAVISISFSIMDAGCPHYVVWYNENEGDIVRVRVDDEESMFFFIDMLMKVELKKSKEPLIERYKEKYRGEIFVWALFINEELIIKKGEEVLTQLSEKQLEESLTQMELLL